MVVNCTKKQGNEYLVFTSTASVNEYWMGIGMRMCIYAYCIGVMVQELSYTYIIVVY